MKNLRTVFVIACVGMLALAGAAMGQDYLKVTAAAAMGSGAAVSDCAVELLADGTDSNAGDNETGPCGLEVAHGTGPDGNISGNVVDNTPDNEKLYRWSFIINPNDFVGTSSLTVQAIFRGRGPNPNPGDFNCPANAAALVDSVGLRFVGLQQGYAVRMRIKNNQCNPQGGSDIAVPKNTPSKICAEVMMASGGNGFFAIAVVDENAACPPTGDAAYQTNVAGNNAAMGIDRAQMGFVVGAHSAFRHVNSFHFDEFESFRTLAP